MITAITVIRHLFTFCVLTVGILYSQNSSAPNPISGEQQPITPEQKPQEKEFIKFTLGYPVGRTYTYIYTDTTAVQRVYSDSSTLDYTRTVTYYITHEALENPRDGLTTIQVTIDSVDYSFSSGGVTVTYKTGSKAVLTLPDLLAAVVPVNRPYFMIYSSYWDVANVEGEMLDWLRQYIEENESKVPQFDTLQKFLWLRNISLPVLAHYGDIQKGSFPQGIVVIDSSWVKPFTILADGIQFRDPKARTRITDRRGPVVLIQTQADSLQPVQESLRLYNLSALATILTGRNRCMHTIEWNNAGFIESAHTELNATVTARVRNDTFNQHITAHYRWKLRGIYEY